MKRRKKLIVKLIRNMETIKTAAIILLMVSCVYFGVLIFQYQAISDAGNVSFFIWNNFEHMFDVRSEEKTEAIGSSREIFSEAAAPECVVINRSKAERMILENGDKEYKNACGIAENCIFSLYNGESRAEAEAIGEEEWISALDASFIYLKLPIEVDNSLTVGTAYEGNIVAKSIKGYDEIVLTAGNTDEKYKGFAVIYLGSSKSRERVRMVLNRSPLSIIEFIERQEYAAERQGIFAFEIENSEFSDYEAIKKIRQLKNEGMLFIDPMLFIPLVTAKTPTVSVALPDSYTRELISPEDSDVINNILKVFGCDTDSARQYNDSRGNVAFMDGDNKITFSQNGEIGYTDKKASALAAGGLEKGSAVTASAELYSMVLKILDIALDGMSPDEKIVISDIDSYKDPLSGDVTISDITFDYTAAGIPVYPAYSGEEGDDGQEHFITARFYNGYLGSLKILVRNTEIIDLSSPNEPAFTAIERYLSESAESGIIRIYNMNLRYRYYPESTKIHTVWVLDGERVQQA